MTLKTANNPVLQYRESVIPAPDPRQSLLQRSGYIYPVFNSAGQPVTDDFPPDHMHQHSVWFAWSRANYEGRQVNFWELSEGKGTIQHVKFGEIGGGAVFAHFTAMLRHLDLTAPDGPKPALNETWQIRAHNVRGALIFDFESTQNCATAAPVEILEHPYGGIAIRGHRNWFNVKNSEYLTSERKTRKDGNHTRPRWVDMYGWIDGKISGIALLSNPENFRFPQPARLHAEKPYFCFAPPALGPFTIEPERPYISRYRFYIHEGRPEPEVIDRVWSDFARPIEAHIISESA